METLSPELSFNPKLSNPKDLIGSTKLPMHLWPQTATVMGALGLMDGMLKYGRSNWRHAGVRASIYFDAFMRHTIAWFEGEDKDPDSKLHHLCHALACLAIIVDAMWAEKLVDDRQVIGGWRKCVNDLSGEVARLKELYKDREPPKHFTIADNPFIMGLDGTNLLSSGGKL